MFRRARLSVKPNVRPSLGARGSTASTPQRGKEAPKPPEPSATPAPKPAEPTDVPVADFGGAAPQEKAPQSSVNDEKTGGEDNVGESSKSPPPVTQRRKRVSSTPSLDKPSASVPSETHPLSTINQEVPQPSTVATKEKKEKPPCSDRYRLYKAQKLREMLKEELKKEKKQWKSKYSINESQRPLDRSKMTMRDFIYYLPNSNPMTSSLEQEKKTEKSSTPLQTREQENKSTPDAEENDEVEEEADDGPLLVPRVKVAEDGSIILDEESLTVEVLRTKGPCVVEENDPIFERGSTTTYSSFRKNYYSKPWSNKETDMFFLAISMVGTDFSMIGQLFPHRARIEIKNKFKREEKTNGWRIDKAFQEKRPFDFDFFAHLLQKVLAEEEKRKQKSVKSNNSKERKPSKPRKKVKVKNPVSEEVNDGPDESGITQISDTEELQTDVQTVEEQPSLTFPAQDSVQIALESNLKKKKKSRRNRGNTEEEGKDILENASVQSSPQGEKHKTKCEPLRSDISEDECNREQKPSNEQNTDDMEDLTFSEKIEKRSDCILSSSTDQDAMSLSTQSSGSNTSDLPSSEARTRALSEVNNAETCTEERNVDLNNKSLEVSQTENVKPMVRGRLQRPKPNLSRAIGKKQVTSQGKTDSENKSSHPETSFEKNHMGKDKMSTFDNLGLENSEKENTEAETVSNLSENICMQEDSPPKTCRPVRPVRGRFQRPKPNVGKVAERKEIVASQENIGADEGKSKNESYIDRHVPGQMEDQSCKISNHEDIAPQCEKKDTSPNVQPPEPKNLCGSVNIQENNEANTLKQSPVVRSLFRKRKPNIGRGTGKKDVSSREEVPEKILVSGEMESTLREIARPETSPTEKVPVETDTAKEMETDLKEMESRDSPVGAKIAEMTDIAVEVESSLRESGRETTSGETILEVIGVREEAEADLEETGRKKFSPLKEVSKETKTIEKVEKDLKETDRDASVRRERAEMIVTPEERDLEGLRRKETPSAEKAPEEVKTIGEVEKCLEETEREISPRKEMIEMIAVPQEREADLEESGITAISSWETVPEMVKTTGEVKKDLITTEQEISLLKMITENIAPPEEREADLEESGRTEISSRETVSEEVKSIGEAEKDLKTREGEISLVKMITDKIAAPEERENIEESGGTAISSWKTVPEEVKPIGQIEKGLEETERENSPRKEVIEMMAVPEEREADLEETRRTEISSWEPVPEKVKTTGGVEKDLKTTEAETSLGQIITEKIAASEERQVDLEETERTEISSWKTVSEEVRLIAEVEKDLKTTEAETSLGQMITEKIAASEERETNLEETERTERSSWETVSEKVKPIGEVEKDLKTTEAETSLGQMITEKIAASEEREVAIEETERTERSSWETVSEEVKPIGEVEKDLKTTEAETSLGQMITEKIAASEERESELVETGRTERSSWETVSEEVKPIGEVEKDLKTTEAETSLVKMVTEKIAASEEREADLEEMERTERSSWETVSGQVKSIGEVEKDLITTEGAISLVKMITEKIAAPEEREAELEESGGTEIWETVSEEVKPIGEVEKDLKTIEEEASQVKMITEKIAAIEEREADLRETREEVFPWEKAQEEVRILDETEIGLNKMERQISPRRKIVEMPFAPEETEAAVEETVREISLREKFPESVKTVGELEKDLKTTKRDICPRESIAEMTGAHEEREADLEQTGEREISLWEKISEDAKTVGAVERKPERDISSRKKTAEVTVALQEEEADSEEIEKDIPLKENSPEEVKTAVEIEKGLEDTVREISPKEDIPEMITLSKERAADLEETGGRKISPEGTAVKEVRSINETGTDLEETGGEISPEKKIIEETSAIGKREIDLKEMEKGNIFLMEKVSGKMSIFEEIEVDLKDANGEISLYKRGSEEMTATEEMTANLKSTGKGNLFPRENEPEKMELLGDTETNSVESKTDDCSPTPSSEPQLNLCSKSKSFPQEQKLVESKTKPFVRSRFKRPKPNLARAVLKRETAGAEKCIPGKKLETAKVDTVVTQQNNEQTNDCPSQEDAASLMTSRAKGESDHKEEKAVLKPCIQTEKNLSRSPSFEPQKEFQSIQAQENDLVASIGACNITLQQEMRESGIQTTQPVRRRLQRPKPNIRKFEQRQIIGKSDDKDIIKEERPVLQKDEMKKLPPEPNSQIGTEIEVVSSKVSECRIDEHQSHVVLKDNLPVNQINVVDENPREETKTYAPSPAPLVRRRFQKATPNVRRASNKRKEPGREEDVAGQSEARKLENNSLPQENSGIQFVLHKKTELLTSPEISARKDYVGPKEAVVAKKESNQSEELKPSESAGKETIGDNFMSSITEEQCLSKPPSCPKRFRESNYSRIALDQRTAISSVPECEIEPSERRIHRKSKPNVTKGRGSKRSRGKSSKKEPRTVKSVLVTLRASQQEDEDDLEDFASDYEEESYHLAPEEVNKAPVFVPLGLRSPEPVATQIEETMEELEIAVDVPDTTCIATVEHQLSNTDVIIQEVMQEENLNAVSIEMTSEHIQDESGTNDGSTEAAIALLTMGDLVLQSEISTEQSDVRIDVLPVLHSKGDSSHVCSSPDNVSHNIVHECQELSSPVISISPASPEENKTVLEEQSARDEAGLMEKIKENPLSTRNTVSKVTSNLRIRNRFPKPKPNLKRILGIRRPVARQEVLSLSVTEGEKVEIQKEIEKNIVKGTELEDKILGSFITAETKEQRNLACGYVIEGTSISQETILTERNEAQEARSQEAQRLLVASAVSSETEGYTFGLDKGFGANSINEPLRKHSSEDSVLTLHEAECIPASIPEVQQENIFNPQDLPVDLFANNVHEDGEDEQAFILTLVEIPANELEEFTNGTAELMPNPLLPAPILVKSVNTEERGDVSVSFPVTSVCQNMMCLSNSGTNDSAKPPANMDPLSRKRVHSRLEESDYASPAKKSSFISGDDDSQVTSEVCSKELINVFEETGASYKGQSIFPTSGSTCIVPEPQQEQLESTLQSIGRRSLGTTTDAHKEMNTSQLPQDGMTVSEREERTHTASRTEQTGNKTSSSKAPLSRRGRRPLGFLSLICSRNNLESDEPPLLHSKKRLKPHIPVSRRNLKRSHVPNASQEKLQEPSDPLPSSSAGNPPSENTDSAAAQVPSDQLLMKEECKSDQNQISEGESVSISEYFFNDIFIEVDEAD
ncbi:transcription factor TFIIIB component B'' homolog [Rhynchocyon petersi]